MPPSPPSGTPSPSPDSTDESAGNSFLTAKPAPTPKEGDAPPKSETTPKPDAAVGAPEKYGDFKLPDGYQFEKAELDKATTIFKDLNLSQDQAQRLVDHYAENSLQAARAPFDYWAQTQKDWTTEITSRFGDRADQTRANINRAIDTLPPSLARGFRAGLELTGAGTHPDLVEGLSILLKPLFEGTPVRGNNPAQTGQREPGQSERPTAAEAMYPHLIKNRPQ